MSVVSITVKLKAVMAEDLSEGEDVNSEEQRAKHGTLGDTMSERGSGGGAFVN